MQVHNQKYRIMRVLSLKLIAQRIVKGAMQLPAKCVLILCFGDCTANYKDCPAPPLSTRNKINAKKSQCSNVADNNVSKKKIVLRCSDSQCSDRSSSSQKEVLRGIDEKRCIIRFSIPSDFQ